MIDRAHDLPISKQVKALNISRGSVYYLPRPMPAADLAIMRRLDRLHLEFPFAGSRMLRGLLSGYCRRIRRSRTRSSRPGRHTFRRNGRLHFHRPLERQPRWTCRFQATDS